MVNYKLQLVSIANLVLIALIVWVWAKFALFGQNDDAFVKVNASKSLSTNQITAVDSIANYHLFGSAQQLYDVPLGQGQTNLKLTLNGTMSQANEKTGLAYISNIQGVQNKYKVGDKVFDSVTLLEIHKTYVVLENNGKKERLSLPEKLATNSQNNQSNKKSSKAPIGNYLKGGDQGNWQQLMQQQKFDPQKISNIVSNSSLVMDQSGSIKGIRVSNLASGAVDLNKVGLKPSDIITSVNGKKVSSQNLLELGKTIQENPNSVVTISRNGKVHNIQININDLNR